MMRDIPVFTTQHGVASLILKEIPNKAEAYIRIQSSLEPELLLNECCNFCYNVGAERIYATGHDFLKSYPLHTSMWHMEYRKDKQIDIDSTLTPVKEESLEQWRSLYNKRMANVPNASYMTRGDAEQQLLKGECYFVYQNDMLIGIGIVSDDKIDAVASVVPGRGRDVVLALIRASVGDTVCIEVALSNNRAVRLYESLGFKKTAEISKWYRIL